MTIVRMRSQNYTIHQNYRDTNNRHTDNGGLRQVALAVEGTLKSKNKLTPTDSSVVRATDTWSKGRGFESLHKRRDSLFSPDSYFGIRSTPCYRSSTE